MRCALITSISVAAALCLGFSPSADAQITAPGTDYVSFWSGDLRVIAQGPNTRVTLIDIDTGLPVNLAADTRVNFASINGSGTNANPFTLASTGDMWVGRGGLGGPNDEIRVRIVTSDATGGSASRPVTAWTGSALASSTNAWGSLIPASFSSGQSFGSEVGTDFVGFLDGQAVFMAPRQTGVTTTIDVTNLSLGTATTLTLDGSIPNCASFPPSGAATCYMLDDTDVQAVYYAGFDDDRVIITANVPISVLTGHQMFAATSSNTQPTFARSDWSYTPPSFAPGDDGQELGTLFYAVVRDSLTIFPTQDNTNVTIEDLSDGDDSQTLTLANGTPGAGSLDIWTSYAANSASSGAIVPRPSSPSVGLQSPNNAFENDVIRITSDKPILVYAGPAGSDVREMADVAFSVPTGPQSRVVYAFAQNFGSSNDLQLFAFQRDTQVSIRGITDTLGFRGGFNDFDIDFDVAPGTSPQVSFNGGAFGACPGGGTCVSEPTPGDIQHFGSGIWGAELVRIESNRPISVITGDIDGANFGAFIPFVPPTVVLPPTAVVTAAVSEVCPDDTTIAFDGSGSFDQDDEGPAPQITRYDWDFGDGSTQSDGPSALSHTFPAVPGDYVVSLTVTDNEAAPDTQTDTGAVTITVLEFSDPQCNQPPVAVCMPVETCADSNTCSASANIDGGSSDPDGDALSFSQDPAGPYGIGVTEVELTVSDGSLSDSCEADVTVNDCAPPEISCPAPSTEECTGGDAATVDPGDATASDDCSGVTVTDPGAASYPVGTTTVTYTATDGAGNSASCDTTVTVEDTTDPTISCPADSSAECVDLQAEVDPGDATASDSCTGVSVNDPGSASYPLGTSTVDYTAVDTYGNSASCTSQVVVEDTLAPELSCPADQTVSADAACMAVVPLSATATDQCWPDDTLTISDNAPPSYGLGSTTVDFSVTDGTGLSDACSTTVTVIDVTPPTVDCNAPPTITPPDAPIDFTATGDDNCSVSVAVTGYDCYAINGAGKRIDKTGSCVVSFAGDTLTIDDVGGVGTFITWTVTAVDGSGNGTTVTCETQAINPGGNGGGGNGGGGNHPNQGVGNGPEEGDPGNSNQGDSANSNDEATNPDGPGSPGNPGKRGGKKK